MIVATVVALTLTFTAPAIPPNGDIFVAEVGSGTYACSVLAGKCVFAADKLTVDNEIAAGRGICTYERSHPAARSCMWFSELKVQQSKRRSARH